MNSYEEKIQRKIDYAKQKSAMLKVSSDKFFEKGFCERTGIPMGQPILVGHHSERRHRNAIKRYESQMRKNLEDYNKSKYYEEKAKRLENNDVISSDDPNAVTKLEEKLKGLEDKRTKIKEYNKKQKAKGEPIADGYHLRNLAGNIRTVKQRIEYLKKLSKIEEIKETYGDIELKVDKDDNRVRLFFPGKPSREVITKLKQNGFRWSPYNQAWQRMLNAWSIRIARDLAKEVNENERHE